MLVKHSICLVHNLLLCFHASILGVDRFTKIPGRYYVFILYRHNVCSENVVAIAVFVANLYILQAKVLESNNNSFASVVSSICSDAKVLFFHFKKTSYNSFRL
jgi:hypothetical protein